MGQISGTHQDRGNSVNQVDENSDMVPACQLSRGTMAFAGTSVWEKDTTPNLHPRAIYLSPYVLATFGTAAQPLEFRESESE